MRTILAVILLCTAFAAGEVRAQSAVDLAVPIRRLEPPGPPPFDQPGFAFGRLSDDLATATGINGHFSADRRSASTW